MGAYTLFKKYVYKTEKKKHVFLKATKITSLTQVVSRVIDIKSNKVYITTRVLKHLYDKKPSIEFYDCIKNLPKIIRYPDTIHANIESKRGDYCFIKKYDSRFYICSLKKARVAKKDLTEETLFVVTIFWLRRQTYLKKYPHIWSWRGDIPSS
ncbi:hypothetical protein KC726_05130 [Candidatus Woesebacteria bacterium]|nr:hypothetical protein [Candidatus Woesebacteria bacterium]